MGIKLHNEVTNRIKNWKVSLFKVELKSFLLDHSFYTVNEIFFFIKVNEIAIGKSRNKF